MKKNYKDLVKETIVEPELNDGYEIYVECDANDGDYLDNTFTLNDIYEDELLFLVLCYLSTDKAFGKGTRYQEAVFGRYLEEDEFFTWMQDYCRDMDLLLFAGMLDQPCHSIVDLSITHHVQALQYEVLLPKVDQIFDSEQEMIDYMTELYEKDN